MEDKGPRFLMVSLCALCACDSFLPASFLDLLRAFHSLNSSKLKTERDIKNKPRAERDNNTRFNRNKIK
jgi:hypothetical protein